MRFAILATPALLASSAMGAILVVYHDTHDASWDYFNACDDVLRKKQGCDKGLFQGSESFFDWKDIKESQKKGRAWCICGDPKKQGYSYAREAAAKLGWLVIQGEEELRQPPVTKRVGKAF